MTPELCERLGPSPLRAAYRAWLAAEVSRLVRERAVRFVRQPARSPEEAAKAAQEAQDDRH